MEVVRFGPGRGTPRAFFLTKARGSSTLVLMDKILVLGNGYVGQEFLKQLGQRGIGLTREHMDFCDSQRVFNFLEKHSEIEAVINAAGYIGKPNVDACEDNKIECFRSNVVLPLAVSDACEKAGIPMGHVSTGCIYDGPGTFTEEDPPNFTFRTGSSFYSGCKAQAEELLLGKQVWMWRIRIPFDGSNNPRNFLMKILGYDKLVEVPNSLSHLGEAVTAALQCITKNVPCGIYNVVNTGAVRPSEIVGLFKDAGAYSNKKWKYWFSEREYREQCFAPRSQCILSNRKIRSYGIDVSETYALIKDCIKWMNVVPSDSV